MGSCMGDCGNICRDCEKEIQSDYSYCPYCGNALLTPLSKYKSYNISVLVGNGFDIAVMDRFNKYGRMKNRRPTYIEFYNYISYYADKKVLESNSIFKRMTVDRNEGKENWSDFELLVDSMVESEDTDYDSLSKDLDAFRALFYEFLSDILSRQIMIDVNKHAMENRLATQSMAYCFGDLDSADSGIRYKINHYNKLVYRFFNFNYTMLLDNYLYLDQKQFDPAKYKHSDMNLDFRPAPITEDDGKKHLNKYTACSTYLISDIFHVHGYYNIPRSILFGTEVPNLNPHNQNDKRKYFCKSHWARDDLKYQEVVDKTNLFIVYGMSISKTDSWWFDRIYKRLLNNDADLIIYYYDGSVQSDDRESKAAEVKKHFFEACREPIDSEAVIDNIHVVLFNDNSTFFLGLDKRTEVRSDMT